jgi:hypothetical protein
MTWTSQQSWRCSRVKRRVLRNLSLEVIGSAWSYLYGTRKQLSLNVVLDMLKPSNVLHKLRDNWKSGAKVWCIYIYIAVIARIYIFLTPVLFSGFK